MGTYWRDSAVVALLIIPMGRAALDRGFQARATRARRGLLARLAPAQASR
jgi:hypothetical protein